LALEIEIFLGPVKWDSEGAQCSKFFLAHCPPPNALNAVNLNHKIFLKSTGNCNVPT
jgi:hypothetical protein